MFEDVEVGLLVLLENTCIRENLLAQHGVSFWISWYGKKYLFDCGQIYVGLKYNFDSLGLDVKDLDAIIISHDHPDHCFALPKLLAEYSQSKIFVPNDFSSVKNKNIVKVKNSIQLQDGLFLSGTLDGKTIGEQFLIMDLGEEGLVIITGCSHPGLENIINSAITITGNSNIKGIVGGFHMVEFNNSEIMASISMLKSFNIDFLVPGHCTGLEAINLFVKEFGDKIKISPMGSIGVGNSMRFSPDFSFDMRGW